MRTLLLAAATIAAIAAGSTAASAQGNTAAGVATGAVTGAIVGGPPGAVVGGIIGGTVGASTERGYYTNDDRYWREPRPALRSCWRDDFGRRVCAYR